MSFAAGWSAFAAGAVYSIKRTGGPPQKADRRDAVLRQAGTWTFEIRYVGRKLAEESFTVVAE